MPIFEYNCSRCRHQFEQIVLSSRGTITCPNCNSSDLEKQLSVFSSLGSGKQAGASGVGCGCTPQTCGCH